MLRGRAAVPGQGVSRANTLDASTGPGLGVERCGADDDRRRSAALGGDEETELLSAAQGEAEIEEEKSGTGINESFIPGILYMNKCWVLPGFLYFGLGIQFKEKAWMYKFLKFCELCKFYHGNVSF